MEDDVAEGGWAGDERSHLKASDVNTTTLLLPSPFLTPIVGAECQMDTSQPAMPIYHRKLGDAGPLGLLSFAWWVVHLFSDSHLQGNKADLLSPLKQYLLRTLLDQHQCSWSYFRCSSDRNGIVFRVSLIIVDVSGSLRPSPDAIPFLSPHRGTAQFMAGMWEFASGNTFAATAFSAYGSFWWSIALTILLPHAVPSLAIEEEMMNNYMGFFLSAWCIFTVIVSPITLLLAGL